MPKRFQMPYALWVNTNSVIQAGAKLEFFESGTSTNLDTYSDSAEITANANPVIADGAGQFPDIFLQGRDYKVTLKDSDDVLFWTADPVIGGIEGSSSDVLAKTSAYTVVTADQGRLITVDATTAAFTVTLPAVASADNGFVIGFHRLNSGSNKVTIDGDGSEIVDLDATYELLNAGHILWLVCNGTKWIKTHETRAKVCEVFTSSGTWTRPKGVRWATVELISGGGGGGGGATGSLFGAGGGGGGYGLAHKDFSGADTHQVTVGAGGTAGTSGGNDGGDGGDSSFSAGGTLVSIGGAGGGQGGNATNTTGGSGGGAASGTDYRLIGGDAQLLDNSGSEVVAGWGAAAARGGGTSRARAAGSAGFDGNAVGGGGAGGDAGAVTSDDGGAGADGLVVVEY